MGSLGPRPPRRFFFIAVVGTVLPLKISSLAAAVLIISLRVMYRSEFIPGEVNLTVTRLNGVIMQEFHTTVDMYLDFI